MPVHYQTGSSGGGGGGTVKGTGAIGQVAFWTAVDTIGGDNGIFWDNTNKRLGLGTTTPLSTFHNAGSATDAKTTVITGDYSVLLTDGNIDCRPVPPSTITVTLPSPVTAGVGKLHKIIDGIGFIVPGMIQIILATAAGSIDGAPTFTMDNAWQVMWVRSDGANWKLY